MSEGLTREEVSRIDAADLYHRLGKLEGLIELNSKTHLATQEQLQVLASALSTLQAKQSSLEAAMDSNRAVSSAGYEGLKSIVIPIAAIIVTYIVARGTTPPCQNHSNPRIAPTLPRVTPIVDWRPSSGTCPEVRRKMA